MHARIRRRRESVEARAFALDDATEFTCLLRLMEAIESKALVIETAPREERIPALMAAIRSTKPIIEMSVGGHDVAKLVPCVTAALQHVRSVMLVLGDEIAARHLGSHVITIPHHPNAIPTEQLA